MVTRSRVVTPHGNCQVGTAGSMRACLTSGATSWSGRRGHPPPYLRTWNIGRSFPMMRPDMRLERVLPAGEAAGHSAHVHIQRPTGDED